MTPANLSVNAFVKLTAYCSMTGAYVISSQPQQVPIQCLHGLNQKIAIIWKIKEIIVNAKPLLTSDNYELKSLV